MLCVFTVKQKQEEKRAKDEFNKEKDRKRKREKYATEKVNSPLVVMCLFSSVERVVIVALL